MAISLRYRSSIVVGCKIRAYLSAFRKRYLGSSKGGGRVLAFIRLRLLIGERAGDGGRGFNAV